jgi:phosphoglycolate phosphatase-like HAD superfamily hydrolase
VVLVDIDGTLAEPNPDAPDPSGPSHPLVAILVQRGLPPGEARARVAQAEAAVSPKPGEAWPFGAERALGVTEEEVLNHLVDDFRRRYRAHLDAVRFMRGLRDLPGVRVYPATTNQGLYILGKLASGGLADATGTPVFDEVFGGEEVSTGGKCGPDFYRALFTRTATAPADCCMVGDEIRPDLEYAQAAGIKRVFIVDREQAAPLLAKEDGGIHVNTLDSALAMLHEEYAA